jgi:hypothetical protein
MIGVILAVLRSLGAAFQPHRQLLLENLALRHQLLVLNRTAGKPKFRNADRLLWVFLCAVFTIVFSVNVVRLFTEFREFAAQADAMFQKCGVLLKFGAISERDALLVLHEHQNARNAAPLIPTRIWRKHGDHLREQWQRFRPLA